MKLSDIKRRKLAGLGFPAATRNALAEMVMKTKEGFVYPRFEKGERRRLRDYWMACAREITAGEIMRMWDAGGMGPRHENPAALEHFQKKLVGFGLTIVDWIGLPRKTATPEALRRIGKKRLLEKSVLVIPTLSWHVLDALRRKFDEKRLIQITVQDFLETTWSMWEADRDAYWWSISRTRWIFNQSITNTRRLFLEIGFSYGDGPFMQEGTRRLLIERLHEEHGLTRKAAAIVADVAAKRGWVAPFRE